MSSTFEALIHQLSVALGHGFGCKPEDGHGPISAVMTTQPFAQGDADSLGEFGDVLCSNLKEDNSSKHELGDAVTLQNEPPRSVEAWNRSRKIVLIDGCRRVDLYSMGAPEENHT